MGTVWRTLMLLLCRAAHPPAGHYHLGGRSALCSLAHDRVKLSAHLFQRTLCPSSCC